MHIHAGGVGDLDAALIVADVLRRGRRRPDTDLLVRVLADIGQPEDVFARIHIVPEFQLQRGVVVEINEVLRCQRLPADCLAVALRPAEQLQPEGALVIIVAGRRHGHIVKRNRHAELDGVIGIHLHRRVAVRLTKRHCSFRHGQLHALRREFQCIQIGTGGIGHQRQGMLPGGQLHGSGRAVLPCAPVNARHLICQRLRDLLSVQKQAEGSVCGVFCPTADHAPAVCTGLLHPHLQINAITRADAVKIGVSQCSLHIQLPFAAVDMPEGFAGVGEHYGRQCGRADCYGVRRSNAERHSAPKQDGCQQERQHPRGELSLAFHVCSFPERATPAVMSLGSLYHAPGRLSISHFPYPG